MAPRRGAFRLATLGTPDRVSRALEVTRFGVSILVADVEDVVGMKRAAGREKDAAHLTTLVEFLKDRTRSRDSLG